MDERLYCTNRFPILKNAKSYCQNKEEGSEHADFILVSIISLIHDLLHIVGGLHERA